MIGKVNVTIRGLCPQIMNQDNLFNPIKMTKYFMCFLVEYFQPSILSEKIYNVTKLPVQVHMSDVVIIGIVGFIMCIIFSLIPALGAALSRPVDVLRDE